MPVYTHECPNEVSELRNVHFNIVKIGDSFRLSGMGDVRVFEIERSLSSTGNCTVLYVNNVFGMIGEIVLHIQDGIYIWFDESPKEMLYDIKKRTYTCNQAHHNI